MSSRVLLVLGIVHHAVALRASGMPRGVQRLAPRASAAFTLDDKPIGSEVTAMQNFILVKLGDSLTMTFGGLIMPDESQTKVTEGSVISAGPGRLHDKTGYLIPNPIEAGDSVLFGEYDGVPCEYCGEDHTLVRDDDVLLRWRGDKTLENVEPVGDRILVRVTKKADETVSGLALSASAAEQQKVSEGVVLKAGEGRKSSNAVIAPMPVKVGQYVKCVHACAQALPIVCVHPASESSRNRLRA